MVKKVIIDCDVGLDDALALILAFHSPELEVEAVTGVSGNVPLDLVFENIRRVLCLIQPRQKPWIARGASRPLKGNPVYAFSFHGKDGLGETTAPSGEREAFWRFSPSHAKDLILELAHHDPGQITLIALGPLTNVAMALQEDPKGMRKLKDLVIMGGAVRRPGNITPFAEFNIFVDPAAADIVFRSGLPVTLVPLDVTKEVALSPSLIAERVVPMENAFSRFLIEATGCDLSARRFRRGHDLFYLHDPLAVGVSTLPDLVRKERLKIQVQTLKGDRFGQTVEVPPEDLEGQGCEVCLTVDSSRFLDFFLSRLGSHPETPQVGRLKPC